jgi:hypothetical protein
MSVALGALLKRAETASAWHEDDRGRRVTLTVVDADSGLSELIAALRPGPTDPDLAMMGFVLLTFGFARADGQPLAQIRYLHSGWLAWNGWERDRRPARPDLLTAWLAERGWC